MAKVRKLGANISLVGIVLTVKGNSRNVRLARKGKSKERWE